MFANHKRVDSNVNLVRFSFNDLYFFFFGTNFTLTLWGEIYIYIYIYNNLIIGLGKI